MQQQVGEVMSTGVHAVKLNVQHVSEPRQWKPVGVGSGLECPDQSAPAESGGDNRVLSDVFGVVIVDEIVTQHRGIDGYAYRDQRECDPESSRGQDLRWRRRR